MQIAVPGTGVVGRTIGTLLAEPGHTVAMESRSADKPAAHERRESLPHQTRLPDGPRSLESPGVRTW